MRIRARDCVANHERVFFSHRKVVRSQKLKTRCDTIAKSHLPCMEKSPFQMKFQKLCICFALGFVSAMAAWAQSGESSQEQSSERAPVVAVIDGVEYTAADVERIRSTLPNPFKQQTASMTNREFLENSYRQLLGLVKLAEKEGLPDKEPYRSQLEYYRMQALAGFYTQNMTRNLNVPNQENLNYYAEHKDEYEEVKVSAIYVEFSPNPAQAPSGDGKKSLSEEEAKAKVEKLIAELRAGADFAGLARNHSDDRASAEKGGDLGFFKRSASLPPALKQVIFDLAEGQISEPVKVGNRYHVLTVTDRRTPAFSEVAAEITAKVRAAKFAEKLAEAREAVSIEYKDEAFLDKTPSGGRPLRFGGQKED